MVDLATILGVSSHSLHRLGIGWSERRQAFAFPMRNAEGVLTGIRLRRLDGTKYAVPGSRDGLFLPDDLRQPSQLLVAEGPTDTAALLGLGFDVVGRPSCTGGTRPLVALIRRHRPQEVVVVADRDEPGQRGAHTLSERLALYAPRVRILTPPAAKDVRAWVNTGATRRDIETAINKAGVRKLQLKGGK